MIDFACSIFASVRNAVPGESSGAVFVNTCFVGEELEVRFADCAEIWAFSVTQTAARVFAGGINAFVVSQPVAFLAAVALLDTLARALAAVVCHADLVLALVRGEVVLMAWLTGRAFADPVEQEEPALALIAHRRALRLANFAIIHLTRPIDALVDRAIKPETSLANVANSWVLAGLASLNIASLVEDALPLALVQDVLRDAAIALR